MEKGSVSNRINWIYYLETKKENIFLYGMSLPTEEPLSENSVGNQKKIASISSSKLYVFEIISDKNPIIGDELNISILCDKLKIQEKIIKKRSVLQVASDVNRLTPESPVISPVKANIFYTGNFYSYNDSMYLDPRNIEDLSEIAMHIAKDTGQSFKQAYAKRLGCFESFNTQPWAENMFSSFEVNRRKDDQKYFFERTGDCSESLLIHLIIYDDYDEILLDTNQVISPDIEFKTFEASFNGADSKYEYWIFNDSGELIDRNKFTFIKSINIGMNIMGNQYDIFTKNFPKKSPLKDSEKLKISTVSSKVNMSIDTNGSEIKTLNGEDIIVYKNISNFFKAKDNLNKGDWFDKGDITKVIGFLNDITNFGSGVITFIDPYIDQSSFEQLLTLKNNELKINLLSCTRKDNLIKKSKEMLDHYSQYNIPLKSISWNNLNNADFHDRFIVTEETSTGLQSIYSLSNSLNNILKNYPLSIVPLRGELKRKAIRYIESLLDKRSDDNMFFPSDGE